MRTNTQSKYHRVKYKRIFIFIFILIAIVLSTYYIVKNLYYAKDPNISDPQLENKNDY